VPIVNDGPRVARFRHELKRRRLTVTRVERLPSNMVRVVLSGEELRGFTSLGFDDHIKLFFPSRPDHQGIANVSGSPAVAATTDAVPPEMRDFTPRRFDAEAGELWIDFFLHEGGPAASWAAQATVGQTLQVGGPKGSAVIAPEGIDAHVLVGDETALPAISRRLEELPAAARILAVIEIDADTERPVLASRATVAVVWVVRDGRTGPPAHQVIDALRNLRFPPGQCFVWVAGESRAARAIRGYFRDGRGFDKKWIKAAGYWQRGATGAHDRIPDES
jgi:NADPH-dependent ferric siderophore reductase